MSAFVRYLLLAVMLTACSAHQARDLNQPRTPAEINAEMGLRYMQQGDYQVALGKLKRALEQDSRLASAHHYIALLYNRLGSTDLAGQHFARAIKLAPGNAAIENNYGVFLCEQGHYREAEARFLRVLQVPDYKHPGEAYENAGLCALRSSDTTKAASYFRRALEFNPLRANSLYQMMKLSFDSGRLRDAQDFLQRYEKVASHSRQSLWLALRIERRLGNQAAARDYAQRLRRRFPDSAEARSLSSQGR